MIYALCVGRLEKEGPLAVLRERILLFGLLLIINKLHLQRDVSSSQPVSRRPPTFYRSAFQRSLSPRSRVVRLQTRSDKQEHVSFLCSPFFIRLRLVHVHINNNVGDKFRGKCLAPHSLKYCVNFIPIRFSNTATPTFHHHDTPFKRRKN